MKLAGTIRLLGFLTLLATAALLLGCDAGRSSLPEREGGSAGGAGGGGGGGALAGSGGDGTGGSDASPAPGGYYTQDNTIYRADGTPHRFHGVARPSLEWNPDGENFSDQDFQRMRSWGANVVRIALNQAYWLRWGPYPNTVDQWVQSAEAAGLDVILDLHWSDRGTSGDAAPQRMADTNSKIFWQQVASKYKDDGRVLFELYNEPHDIGWAVWRDGGDSGDGFTVVGMQELYDSVRATGADNLVIIGGLSYAYDLSQVKYYRIKGYNIAYATHPYDYTNKQPSAWPSDWGYLAATDPVIITEFGNTDCGTDYYQAVINYADGNNISWTAWAWYVAGCDFPSLISDWQGDPTAAGIVVRSALESY